MRNQLVRNQTVQYSLKMARYIHLTLQANYLVQVPKVWQLVSLVGLGKREWGDNFLYFIFRQVEGSRSF